MVEPQSLDHETGKIRCIQNRCGLPPSEHEVLFRRREIVETMMEFLKIVEVEIGGQLSVQLTHHNANTA